MQIKKTSPADLAIDLLSRSICSVRVAAVLADKHGVFGWGWNGVGSDGLGEHAEAHCLRRSNNKRLAKATMWVAAVRHRTGKPVTAKPCEQCQKAIRKVGKVMYRDGDGIWKDLR